MHAVLVSARPLPDSVARRLVAVAAGRDAGDGFSGTRSVLMHLPEPLPGGIHTLKLKGVGYCRDGKRVPPQMRDYLDGPGRPFMAISVARDGRITARRAPARPVGGMLYAGARNEYLMTRAAAAGVPVVLPVACGEYPRLRFRGRRIGIVVLGLPGRHDCRLGEEWLHLLNHAAAARAPARAHAALLPRLRRDSATSGQLLRQLHAAGFVNSATNLSNICGNEGGWRLCDLDLLRRTRGMTGAQELGWRLKDYYVLALSLARRACVPYLRRYRHRLLDDFGRAYVGPGYVPGRLLLLDHLRAREVLTGGAPLRMAGLLVQLLRAAVAADRRTLS